MCRIAGIRPLVPNSRTAPIELQHDTDPLSGLRNTLHAGDNDELFGKLPADSIDLLLTDPPYKDYQSNRPVAHDKVKKICARDFEARPFFDQVERVLKPGAHFYCWCDHLTFPGLVAALEGRPTEGLRYKNCLVWVKNNHGAGDLKSNWAPQHEFILFACKGRARPIESRRRGNVLYYKDDEDRIRFFRKVSNYDFEHGTVKPIEILKILIEMSTAPGELVFDPYAGSCSTGEAALACGRDYLLAELDPDHARRGDERLDEVRRALSGKSRHSGS